MRWYTSDVEARIAFLKQHVPTVLIALPAWGGDRTSWFLPDDHESRYGCVRDQLLAVARQSGITTIDMTSVLCPAGSGGECPAYRERDGLHVDPEDAAMVLDWLLDQIGADANG